MADSPVATALVVDDNYYNRDLCRLALENVGYQVQEVDNGQKAVDVLSTRSFDLLVLDLAMPELTGVEVLRQIGDQSRHQQMSIVVMTANPHMATEEVEKRVDFTLLKPIDVQDFARFAQRLVKHRHS